jgi:probable F420-dependent oxidoreductase
MDQTLVRLPVLDPLTVLSHAAAVTDSIRLATGVLLVGLRHPVQLAREAATVDQLSGGRLLLGVGLGAQGSFDPAWEVPAAERAARFAEGLDLVQRLWSNDRVTHAGRFWRLEDVEVEPKPVQKPHPPLWFGAGWKPALERAVRRGDGWIGAGASTIEEFSERAAVVRGLLAEAGRDPGAFGIAKRVYVAVTDRPDAAWERMRSWSRGFYGRTDVIERASIVGDLEHCVAKLAELRVAGASLIVLNPVFDQVEQMRLLAPALREL